MDNRGYNTGYSSWSGGGSSSRGSGGYDSYGFGYGKDSDSGFGGYGGAPLPKRGLSGGSSSSLSTTGTSADAVIAKINQRLDMLTQLEGAGGMKGVGRSDRSGYGYSDGGPDLMPAHRGGSAYGGPGSYDGSGFGSGKSHSSRQPRDAYGQSWPGRRSPRGPGGGRGFGRWHDPPMGGRGAGGGPPSSGGGGGGKLPSLLSHHMYPEGGPFHPPGAQEYAHPGKRYGAAVGTWAGRQRVRKRTPNRVKMQKDGKKKRKQSLSAADEPDSKMGKTETGAESANEAEEPSVENEEVKTKDESEGAAEGEDALTMQEEIKQMKRKLQGRPPAPDKPKPKTKKRSSRFLERVMFACSVCKFRSFYNDEMTAHLDSRFHKEHFKYLASKLSKPTTDFLQEYLSNKYKKTEMRRSHMENISAAICQVYKEQDLTRDLGMEHFMKKVEAAHCAACDLFIPMQPNLLQKHLKSPDHNFNRRGMMEQSKRASLSVARSILNHKVIGKKLESYLKGENPFTGNPDDPDPDESMAMDVTEGEMLNESQGEGGVEGEGEEEEEEEAAEGEGSGGVQPESQAENEGESKEEEEEEEEGAGELGLDEEGEMEGIPGEEVLEEEEEAEGEMGGKDEGVEEGAEEGGQVGEGEEEEEEGAGGKTQPGKAE
ncbi:A-kinase anchor protein 8-like isoform X2 [Amia ocellicauda]|uniref:A-kinase anchor protein 8-like isoform X2 n=1 Tax=Amia ocellicauda TaxID=2972642 RepID=UPI003464E336